MGLTLIRLNRIDEARVVLEKSIDKDSQNLSPRIALAQIFEHERNFPEAAEQYKKCLELEPGNLLLLTKLGSMFFVSKDYASAENIFKKVKELYPKDPTGDLWLSLLCEEKKEWEQAALYLESTLKDNPAVTSYIRLSYYYSQLPDNKRSMNALGKARKLDPGSPEPWFFMGLSYMDQKKYGKAEKHLLKALSLNPDIKEAHFYLGVIYEQTNRFEKSVPRFRRVIELDPANASASNYLGYSYADRNLNLDEAEKLIKRALELDPDNAAYTDSLGWLYFRKGDLSGAETYLSKAASLMDDPVVLEHLGDVRVKLGRNTEALEDYRKALGLAPENDKLRKKIKSILLPE